MYQCHLQTGRSSCQDQSFFPDILSAVNQVEQRRLNFFVYFSSVAIKPLMCEDVLLQLRVEEPVGLKLGDDWVHETIWVDTFVQ